MSIGVTEMLEYLAGYSDLSFELETLRLIKARGLVCQHGGLYQDPATKKMRQFDIRAFKREGNFCVRLAVECKNVRDDFPLLVLAVPRQNEESFNEVVITADFNSTKDVLTRMQALPKYSHVVRVDGSRALYRPGAPVGKSLTQVGRERSGIGIRATDTEVFDKWSQCLASAEDLVSNCFDEPTKNSDDSIRITCSVVKPFLVVPNERLWMVEFDENGKRMGDPYQTDHCTLFVGRTYDVSRLDPDFHVSHLAIVTSNGLVRFIDEFLGDAERMQGLFHYPSIDAAITKLFDD